MIVEYAQLMSTAHRMLDGNDQVYKPTHPKHPSTIWTRESKANYEWLFAMWTMLLDEYTYRYGKKHACERLYGVLCFAPTNIQSKEFTEPTPAMPDEYKIAGDSIASYRLYYNKAKTKLLTWKKRPTPEWITI